MEPSTSTRNYGVRPRKLLSEKLVVFEMSQTRYRQKSFEMHQKLKMYYQEDWVTKFLVSVLHIASFSHFIAQLS